jgi:hypothetical protein
LTCRTAGAGLSFAIGMARLEHKVAHITRVGNDPFGRNLRPALWKDKREMVSVINDLASRADTVNPRRPSSTAHPAHRDKIEPDFTRDHRARRPATRKSFT